MWLQLESNPEPLSSFAFRFRTCFEQGVPWHSGNYRMWIHSETRTWHDMLKMALTNQSEIYHDGKNNLCKSLNYMLLYWWLERWPTNKVTFLCHLVYSHKLVSRITNISIIPHYVKYTVLRKHFLNTHDQYSPLIFT